MNVAVIGASTGGPRIIQQLLEKFPQSFHGIVIIVQHMPGLFTKQMAERLDKHVPFSVKEMQVGESLQSGTAYIVPGEFHFFLSEPGNTVHLVEGGKELKPSIDMGFTSLAEHFGPKMLAVVLTGMGEDGTIGAKAVKQVGGHVIVQDEETSPVYGMPRSVQIAGHADESLQPEAIAKAISKHIA